VSELFRLRGEVSSRTQLILGVAGLVLVLGIWSLVSGLGWVSRGVLPAPWEVLTAYKDLHFEDALVRNVIKSILLNLQGYFWAIIVAIPLGFSIGLLPLFKGLFEKQVDALRFIPLTAVTGLFMAWFGIGNAMKISFLAFGIFVYLVPVVVQRVRDVKEVYIQTVYTLGATSFQTIKTVFLPSVLSKISDDIRVLVAISWTYIIVAEMVNSSEGGVGALIWKKARQAEIDKVFAVLLIIVLVGVFQDKLFGIVDRLIFKFKHQKKA